MSEKRPKNSWLFQTLLLSGALNLVLTALLALNLFYPHKGSGAFAFKPAPKKELTTTLQEGAELSYEELLAHLSDPTKRQGALAALATLHHFDVKRALGVDKVSFVRLKEADFDKIAAFAAEELWPLTSEGLIIKLKELGAEAPKSLLEALVMTPEFRTLERLFLEESVTKNTLITLVYEGSFALLADYYDAQRTCCDFSKEMQEKVLLDFSAEGSKTAQRLLAGRTSDLGPRPGLKNLRPLFRDQPPASPAPQVHIIQPGESLWLIARKYGVPIELLMEINHLPSTTIQPGKTLKIPMTENPKTSLP